MKTGILLSDGELLTVNKTLQKKIRGPLMMNPQKQELNIDKISQYMINL